MRDNRDRNSFQFKYLYLFDLLKSCISSVPYILTIATEYIHSAKSNLLLYCFTLVPYLCVGSSCMHESKSNEEQKSENFN